MANKRPMNEWILELCQFHNYVLQNRVKNGAYLNNMYLSRNNRTTITLEHFMICIICIFPVGK